MNADAMPETTCLGCRERRNDLAIGELCPSCGSVVVITGATTERWTEERAEYWRQVDDETTP